MSLLRAESNTSGLVAAARGCRLGMRRNPCRPGQGGQRTLALMYFLLSLTTFFLSYPVLGKGAGSDGDWGGSCRLQQLISGPRGDGLMGGTQSECCLHPLPLFSRSGIG